jgi:glycosyltransferase involved in cell wall biosynthesis
LKGADVLIEAFQRIAHRFPSHRLKIAGFGPDCEFFERLCKGENRIELITPVPHSLALQLISACSVFVLPSRTEAMGRVLLEAMAFRKPIVASRVEGIPTYVRDGYNGILFQPGDVEDLAKKLDCVLSDAHLAATLAENGYETVHEHLSEAKYCERFNEMIEAVIRKS